MFRFFLNKFVSLMIITFISFSIFAISSNADARRIGNGGSYGKTFSNIGKYNSNHMPNIQNSTRKSYSSNSSTKRDTYSSKNQQNNKNIFSTILASLGLAALFSYLGLGSLISSTFSLILIILFIYSVFYFIKKSSQNKFFSGYGFDKNSSNCAYNNHENIVDAEIVSDYSNIDVGNSSNIYNTFNKVEFINNAKNIFILIQEIWMKGDLNSLRDYITDDLLNELENQFNSSINNNFKVITLEAELLDIKKIDYVYFASVNFYGSMKHEDEPSDFYFEEIWNFQKDNDSGWLLSGIQQKN